MTEADQAWEKITKQQGLKVSDGNQYKYAKFFFEAGQKSNSSFLEELEKELVGGRWEDADFINRVEILAIIRRERSFTDNTSNWNNLPSVLRIEEFSRKERKAEKERICIIIDDELKTAKPNKSKTGYTVDSILQMVYNIGSRIEGQKGSDGDSNGR